MRLRDVYGTDELDARQEDRFLRSSGKSGTVEAELRNDLIVSVVDIIKMPPSSVAVVGGGVVVAILGKAESI